MLFKPHDLNHDDYFALRLLKVPAEHALEVKHLVKKNALTK
jgi:hypothetical protein